MVTQGSSPLGHAGGETDEQDDVIRNQGGQSKMFPAARWYRNSTETGLPLWLVARALGLSLPTVMLNLTAPQPDCWEPDFGEEFHLP